MLQVAPSGAGVVDRRQVIQAYRENRARTRELFEMLTPDAYYERPIPLRHPVVFYDGHISAFAVNTLLKKGLGHPGIDGDLEVLFARGIDPADRTAASASTAESWPSRDAVRRYVEQADDAVLTALRSAAVEGDGNAVLRRGQGVFTILEHEEMHQETLLYMWRRLDARFKRRPRGYDPTGAAESAPVRRGMVTIPTGGATLGAGRRQVRFGWDNEFPSLSVEVPAFAIDVHDVTNAEYRGFVDAGGYDDPVLWSAPAWRRRRETGRAHPLFWERSGGEWCWRGMFGRVPLPQAWPVYVTHDEASAFARWKGLRLPTEAEYHRAAFGTPDGSERAYPWGDEAPDETRGNFDFRHWDPAPAGSFPAGASAWGVHDLAGNGWEWTSTPFAGFPGFEAMASYPEYSADFFDGEHFVAKGASPATARGLVRRSFRNWFRPHYTVRVRDFPLRRRRAVTALEAISERPAATGRSSRDEVPAGGDEVLARDVVKGLTTRPKRLAAKYLYDALGSRLFEAICELPWYPITRGERALLTRERDAILARLDDPATLVELGGGNGEKLAILAAGLAAEERAATVHLVDISETALARAGRALARHSSIAVHGHRGSYAAGLRTAVAAFKPGRSAMVLFLGSNIGNLSPSEADRFLADVGAALRSGDSLLLGTDLVKPEQELVLAYDDPLGVTAAFNRNLLVRLNRELDADFEIEQFAHRVVWNARESRIESHLVSRAEQTVCLPAAGCCVRFAEGETIWTESSYKYRPDDVVDLAARAGFAYRAQWIEPDAAFALTLFEAP